MLRNICELACEGMPDINEKIMRKMFLKYLLEQEEILENALKLFRVGEHDDGYFTINECIKSMKEDINFFTDNDDEEEE